MLTQHDIDTLLTAMGEWGEVLISPKDFTQGGRFFFLLWEAEDNGFPDIFYARGAPRPYIVRYEAQYGEGDRRSAAFDALEPAITYLKLTHSEGQ